MQVIRISSRQYQTPFAHADDEPLRNCYDYAESDDSCEFFLPYTWQVVFETGGLAWDPRNIRLFDPKVRCGACFQKVCGFLFILLQLFRYLLVLT